MSIIKPNRFVGLHAHSGFSVNDGLGYPQEHIDYIINNGMDAWALTEHGHMNSFAHAYLHSQKLKKAGGNFKFIPGCEMYLHPDLNLWEGERKLALEAKAGAPDAKRKVASKKQEIVNPLIAITDHDDETVDVVSESEGLTIENEEESKSNKFFNPINRRHHLVVLPKTSEGLQRLFHLVSRGYSEGFYRYPRIDFKMLKEASAGGNLMISTACIGGQIAFEVFKHFQQLESINLNPGLLDDQNIRAQIMMNIGNTYDRMVDAVGADSAMLELQFNKLPAQHLTNRAIIEFAKQNGIEDKLIVTCDSHYSQPDHWKEREIYKQLGFLGKKEPDPSLLPNSKEDLKCELYPKNHEQVWETYNATRGNFSFYDDQLICDAIERTHDIAHQFIGDIKPDTSMKLPSYVVPKNMSADKALIELCKDGLINRGLSEKPEYIERLHYELKVIKEKQFSKYFLTKKKIIDLAWKKMFVGPGRGSGAGSLVNYVLGITDIDPIKYDLLFERFLDPSRTEYPDIDTDVSDRDALIKSLRTEFGVENVVPISNYNTFKLKSLIKDVARFYGISFQEVNSAIASLESDVKAGRKSEDADEDAPMDISIEEALKFSPKTKKFLEEHEEIFEPLQVLFKQNRALGRHAGGVIVSEDIAERMPLIMTKGERQTPWVEGMTAKHLESFGWVKFDLLGLETLRMFEMTIERILKKAGNKSPSFEDIKSWYNTHLNPTTMNLDDQRVYEEIYHAGAFAAVFQCTQKGAQALFKKAKPVSIMDIATLTAIYRPGPLSAKVDQTYIKAKQNPASVDYGHPLIKQVLEPEYGHIVFQESAMSLCHIVAGIPKLELNTVRKMMKPGGSSGENIEKAKALRERFVSGCVANGVEVGVAEKLYEKILWFSAYGFNKCLHGDSAVETPIGKKKIKDVVIGDKVLAPTGFVDVKNCFQQGKKEVFKITTKSGKVIECTLDHKIMTEDGMKPLREIIKKSLKIATKA